MNPPSLPYHGALGPVNILDLPSAKLPQTAKAHPACPESSVFTMPSGRPSKIKQSNRPGVGEIHGFFSPLDPSIRVRSPFSRDPARERVDGALPAGSRLNYHESWYSVKRHS